VIEVDVLFLLMLLSHYYSVISPMLASAATFTVYVLVDENNILTASETFSVLLLFSALRFPINYAGRLIGSKLITSERKSGKILCAHVHSLLCPTEAAQAFAAVHRITLFLDREIRDIDLLALSDEGVRRGDQTAVDTDPPLKLENAAFIVGFDQGLNETPVDFPEESAAINPTLFKISKFDVSVKKGEVLALVGPVGSGKSSFVNGIIDEVPATPGTLVATKGTVAFVPQTPFILNTTLRENILFGLAFDLQFYEKVLDACCLRPDIEQLGEAGDLTEIGERGVTLSGGKSRIEDRESQLSC